jgi:hypothetical protein
MQPGNSNSDRDQQELIRVYRRRPRPRCHVLFPSFFEHPTNSNPREDSSVCDIGPANLAIRGRGRRVRDADEQELIPTRIAAG